MCVDERKLLNDGPDPIAVVIAVEEKFNITIPDEDAEKILNMGQLYDYVHARISRGQQQVCFTSAAFYRLRRALGEVCHVPRERVRLQTLLEDLIPLENRPRYWQELQARLGDLHLPCLCRPLWLVKRIESASSVPMHFAGVLCIMVLSFALLALPREKPASSALMMLAIIACPVISILLGRLLCRELCRRTKHYAIHIPPSCATVRDLVYALVGGHRALRMVSDTERANDKEIWGTLCAVVGGDFDRPPGSFTRESTFY